MSIMMIPMVPSVAGAISLTSREVNSLDSNTAEADATSARPKMNIYKSLLLPLVSQKLGSN